MSFVSVTSGTPQPSTRWRRFRIRQPRRRLYRYVRRRWRVLFALVDAIGYLLFFPWWLRRSQALRRCRAPGARFLLVQLDRTGDAILSTGLVQALKQLFPQARLDVLCVPWNAEVFQALPEVDRVWVMPTSRFARAGRGSWLRELWRWGRLLRRERYTLGIDPRGEAPHALLLWLAGCRVRLGFACGGGGFWLTHRAKFELQVHEIHRRRELLAALGLDARGLELRPRWPGRATPPRQFRPGPEAGPCVVCHVGAGTQAKSWPRPYWRQLISWLLQAPRATVYLVGGPSDGETAWLLQNELGHPARLHDATGQLTWSELAGLLARAHLCIGADSAVVHLAVAVDCPVVALFSRTNQAAVWRPWGRGVVLQAQVPCGPCHREQCPVPGHPCMSWLTPQRVIQAAGLLLKKGIKDTKVPCVEATSGEFLLQSQASKRYNAADT